MQETDNFAYVIPVDNIFHTEDTPFCFVDGTCPCRDDQAAIERVNQWMQDGLLTPQEATNFVAGKMV